MKRCKFWIINIAHVFFGLSILSAIAFVVYDIGFVLFAFLWCLFLISGCVCMFLFHLDACKVCKYNSTYLENELKKIYTEQDE